VGSFQIGFRVSHIAVPGGLGRIQFVQIFTFGAPRVFACAEAFARGITARGVARGITVWGVARGITVWGFAGSRVGSFQIGFGVSYNAAPGGLDRLQFGVVAILVLVQILVFGVFKAFARAGVFAKGIIARASARVAPGRKRHQGVRVALPECFVGASSERFEDFINGLLCAWSGLR